MRRDTRTGTPDFFVFARDYLHTYLPTIRGLSANTIEAYRISLECFLTFLTDREHIDRATVSFDHFDRARLKAWLVWLADDQHYATRTVTLRLSAIKAFLAYAAAEDVTLVALSQAARSLKTPSAPRKPIEYLTEPQTRALLAAFTGQTAKSRRNRMLLILLYDTAARVGEITGLTLADLSLTQPGRVMLTGKRAKSRIVPLTDPTVEHLRIYLREFHPNPTALPATRPLFYSHHHGQPTKLSVDTVSAMLKQAAQAAREICPDRGGEHPLPHAAKDQGHGPLPARNPAADHHAAPRTRERLDHSGVLRLRHPRHDARRRQRRHPDHRHPHRAPSHRRPAPNPL